MDLLALLLSVEVTRRDAGSALPGAEVRPPRLFPRGRWRRARRAPGPYFDTAVSDGTAAANGDW